MVVEIAEEEDVDNRDQRPVIVVVLAASGLNSRSSSTAVLG